MSDTIWVAIITAIATTVPQIIIALINYRKDIKQRQLELFNQNRLNIIIEFLDTVGGIYSNDSIALREKSDFEKSLNKLLLYFPDIDSKEFANIFNSTKEWDTAKRCEALRPLIKQLSKSIKDK